MNYLYMLRCEDNSLYTGITKELYKRMDAHFYHRKEGAKYTKSRQPVTLCMVWETDSWSSAAKLEYFVKNLNKKKKEELLENPRLLQEWYNAKKKEADIMCIPYLPDANYPIFLKDFLAKNNCSEPKS